MLNQWLETSNNDAGGGSSSELAETDHCHSRSASASARRSTGTLNFRNISGRMSMSIFGLPRAPERELRRQQQEQSLRARCSQQQHPNNPQSKWCHKNKSLFDLGDPKRGGGRGGGVRLVDPGSPQVSCVGRIKLKHKELKTLASSGRRQVSFGRRQASTTDRQPSSPRPKRFSWLKKLFWRKNTTRRVKADPGQVLPEGWSQSEIPPRSSCPDLAMLRGVSSSRRESYSHLNFLPRSTSVVPPRDSVSGDVWGENVDSEASSSGQGSSSAQEIDTRVLKPLENMPNAEGAVPGASSSDKQEKSSSSAGMLRRQSSI